VSEYENNYTVTLTVKFYADEVNIILLGRVVYNTVLMFLHESGRKWRRPPSMQLEPGGTFLSGTCQTWLAFISLEDYDFLSDSNNNIINDYDNRKLSHTVW